MSLATMTQPTPATPGRYLTRGPQRDDLGLAVFALCRIRGRTQHQAAESLGISRSTAQRLLLEAEADIAAAEHLGRFRR